MERRLDHLEVVARQKTVEVPGEGELRREGHGHHRREKDGRASGGQVSTCHIATQCDRYSSANTFSISEDLTPLGLFSRNDDDRRNLLAAHLGVEIREVLHEHAVELREDRGELARDLLVVRPGGVGRLRIG